MRCPCGYTVFARRTVRTSEIVSRWLLSDSGATPGAGATPAGLGAGTSSTSTWGRYEVPLVWGRLEMYCVSCKRIRTTERVGGLAYLGYYESDGAVYVVAADVVRPVTCFSLRYTGPEGVTYSVPLSSVAGTPPSIFGVPLETAETPPVGAVLAQQLLVGAVPEVNDSGTYVVEIVDRCANNVIPVLELELEANMQILIPQNADLNGAPAFWLKDFDVNIASASQPAGSPMCTIPFDRCRGVIEYDARLGSLPTLQGWSLAGSGTINDFGVVDGSALRMNTTVASYFEKSLTLSTNPGRVHGYIQYRRSDFSGARGLDLQALYGTSGQPHAGARLNARESGPYKMELDGGGSTPIGPPGPVGWESLGGSQVTSGPGVAWRDGYAEDATATYGTVGTAGATEIRARFGDTAGDGLVGYLRHVVVSAPGRFIRAGFVGYADAAEPTLRFGLSRLVDADLDNTARFKIVYGQSGTVYGAQPSTLSFTAALSTPNNVVEFSLKLAGLLAQRPFWFTVERDWAHGDDLFDSTVHLHYVTVRSK